MTPEERHMQMQTRNTAICAYYQAGNKLAACASHFRLGKQRILQVLKAGGVWRPYAKTNRTKFLGVSVSEETKDALQQKAKAEGKSTSKFASDVLDEAVR